jgi:F420-dependent oxidoreductase-like protein
LAQRVREERGRVARRVRAATKRREKAMKLGLMIGYSGADMRLPIDRILRAEALGYDSVWTAEAYGSDAITPLAYIAALTKRIRLGTGVIQLAARTPANAAMSAATVDALAGGNRFILGVGVSGPQIVEGWYGQPWGKPYYRIRDYVTIMRKVLAREAPVTHQGREISLPYTGPGASGLSKPLKSILHMNPKLPIWLGAENEATVKLCAEICDGWLPMGLVPGSMPHYRPWLEAGFRRAGGGKSFDHFEIFTAMPVIIDRDVKGALARLKPNVALYVGGMGARSKNFHKDLMARQGFAEAAERIQELYLAGRKQEAAEAVPDELVDLRALVGPPARIRERYKAWADCGASGALIPATQDEVIELMAQVADLPRP